MKRHKCKFAALHSPTGDGDHAHQCLYCDETILVGNGKKCDGKPATHREVS